MNKLLASTITDLTELCLIFQRLIDKAKVTCIKWIPGSPNQFLVSHASGQMYVYNEELQCGPTPPHYQMFKQGEGYDVFTCKTKSTRNPLYRWVVGEGAINEFAFSPCSHYLAIVSQDGYLRVFDYNSMELVDSMRSYFGGLLCVCWSPDGKYVVAGGEDDLVTVWSFHERRVVCRGQGHKSWVNMVAFDPWCSSIGESEGNMDFTGSDEDFSNHTANRTNHNALDKSVRTSTRSNTSSTSKTSSDSKNPLLTSYRFGSVGQDTQMCLWDLTEDVLRQPLGRTRTSTVIPSNAPTNTIVPTRCNSLPNSQVNSVGGKGEPAVGDGNLQSHSTSSVSSSFTQKFATLALGER